MVVKVISTHDIMGGQSESTVDQYADIRLELNKLCSSFHKYIVHFIGITMYPLSFVMEWAPLGSLKRILTSYREARCSMCPESVLQCIHQVCIDIHVHMQHTHTNIRTHTSEPKEINASCPYLIAGKIFLDRKARYSNTKHSQHSGYSLARGPVGMPHRKI